MLKEASDIFSAASGLSSVSLEGMKRVKLMNRVDTKFLLPVKGLPGLLRDASRDYAVLEIDGQRGMDYRTVYFDTPQKKMYALHHSGKLNRYKIRKREYLISSLAFLEVKFKNNKGRTKKNRIRVDEVRTDFNLPEGSFLNQKSPFAPAVLEESLWNWFSRLTLAHRDHQERVTMDFDLCFGSSQDVEKSLPWLCVVEVKQEGFTPGSPVMRLLKKYGARQSGFSKYCIGKALLEPTLKKNRFKEKLLLVDRVHRWNENMETT